MACLRQKTSADKQNYADDAEGMSANNNKMQSIKMPRWRNCTDDAEGMSVSR